VDVSRTLLASANLGPLVRQGENVPVTPLQCWSQHQRPVLGIRVMGWGSGGATTLPRSRASKPLSKPSLVRAPETGERGARTKDIELLSMRLLEVRRDTKCKQQAALCTRRQQEGTKPKSSLRSDGSSYILVVRVSSFPLVAHSITPHNRHETRDR